MNGHKKTIFGWCMYDWANSAFATTILAAVLPIYFVSIVPEGGVDISILGFTFHAFATPLWSFSITIAMVIVALSAPVLGARTCLRAATNRGQARWLPSQTS